MFWSIFLNYTNQTAKLLEICSMQVAMQISQLSTSVISPEHRQSFPACWLFSEMGGSENLKNSPPICQSKTLTNWKLDSWKKRQDNPLENKLDFVWKVELCRAKRGTTIGQIGAQTGVQGPRKWAQRGAANGRRGAPQMGANIQYLLVRGHFLPIWVATSNGQCGAAQGCVLNICADPLNPAGLQKNILYPFSKIWNFLENL